MTCRLCSSKQLHVFYEGSIRSGGVGSDTVDGFKVLQCELCNFVFLDPLPENIDSFYETHEYRCRFDYEFDPESIHRKYGHEQNARLMRIGVENLRGRSVLDLGASAGVFLEVVQGVSARTIAVEPGQMYRDYLEQRGHSYYAYPQDAIDAGELVDVVTSFDVIEHIPDPRKFIESAWALLKPGGVFFLSMPNLDDLVLRLNRERFSPFFFQVAHLNYFSSEVVAKLFADSCFADVKIDYLHKYGVENILRWAKYGSPGAMDELRGLFDRAWDGHYKAEIERLGVSSHLFVVARKE